jgi:pyruvate/2-oxoglutarate/acetoin dehydrogenase E1 component
MTRKLTYAQAIREAFEQLLATDPRVFVMGQGLWSPWYVGTTMQDLDRRFGRDRILDTPVSENATTGAAIGAALAGMRPIVVHPRMDFMLLAADPIINQAANWSYMFGGQIGVPLVIRSIINRGGQQGAQHSQALQALFAHVPGLKVVMPATPYDAKGLLIAAVRDGNPVMYIDDRWLYESVGEVPAEMYEVRIGAGEVRRIGRHVTIAASSWMVGQALNAADTLQAQGISAEVIDLRSIKPWPRQLVLNSVRKTGLLIVADGGWTAGGVGAEIAAAMSQDAFDYLRAPIERVALPDAPAPTSRALEQAYYPTDKPIIAAAQRMMLRAYPLARKAV